MAGKLTQIDTNTITSSVSSIITNGISTDNVHMLVINNLSTSADLTFRIRFTASGSPVGQPNYNRALRQVRVDSGFTNTGSTNASFYVAGSISTLANNETYNAVYYLYNFNNANEYSIAQLHDSFRNTDGFNRGNIGGFIYDVDQALDGVEIYSSSTPTFESGTITLYRID